MKAWTTSWYTLDLLVRESTKSSYFSQCSYALCLWQRLANKSKQVRCFCSQNNWSVNKAELISTKRAQNSPKFLSSWQKKLNFTQFFLPLKTVFFHFCIFVIRSVLAVNTNFVIWIPVSFGFFVNIFVDSKCYAKKCHHIGKWTKTLLKFNIFELKVSLRISKGNTPSWISNQFYCSFFRCCIVVSSERNNGFHYFVPPTKKITLHNGCLFLERNEWINKLTKISRHKFYFNCHSRQTAMNYQTLILNDVVTLQELHCVCKVKHRLEEIIYRKNIEICREQQCATQN